MSGVIVSGGLDEGDREIGRSLPGLASEGTGRLRVAVLSRDLDVFAQKFEDGD